MKSVVRFHLLGLLPFLSVSPAPRSPEMPVESSGWLVISGMLPGVRIRRDPIFHLSPPQGLHKTWANCILFLWSSGRQEFVDAYVNYVFQISVHEWYTAFSSGFLKVCGGKVLELFQPSELRAMMVGNSNYNWQELEEVSRDGAVFTSEEAAVAWPGGPRAWSLSKRSGVEEELEASLSQKLQMVHKYMSSIKLLFFKIGFFFFLSFLGRLPSTRVIIQPHIPL